MLPSNSYFMLRDSLLGNISGSALGPEELPLPTDEIKPKLSFALSVIVISCYAIIFMLGISGNSLVVYVVCRSKAMQSVTNVFIMNLALSDILMCLLAVPFTPLSFFLDNWTFGKFLCHLVPFSLGTSVYVSTLTSLAIAIDRYFVIVHPFKPRMKLGVCVLLIAVVWIVAISISLPLAIYVKFNSNMNKTTCKETWPIPMLKRFFDIASLVLQYLIPFAVITYSYTKVWIILSKRTRPGKTKEKEQLELKRKKRTNRMLVAMVIIFAGCWMPLNAVHLTMEFKENFMNHPNFSAYFFVAHVIAMSSTIYNPFLYAWLNDNFRKEFRLVIPCIFSVLRWCRSLSSDKSKSANLTEILDEEESKEHKGFTSVNRQSITMVDTSKKSKIPKKNSFISIQNDDREPLESRVSDINGHTIREVPKSISDYQLNGNASPESNNKVHFKHKINCNDINNHKKAENDCLLNNEKTSKVSEV